MLGTVLGSLLGARLGMTLGLLLPWTEGLLLARILGAMLGRLLGALLGVKLGETLGLEESTAKPERTMSTVASFLFNNGTVMVRVSPLLPVKLLIVYDWPRSSDASDIEILDSTDVSLETIRTWLTPS